MVEGEEGAPELFDCAAALAEPVACRKVEDPDADDREDDQSGDPDVTRDVVVLDSREDKAAEHRKQAGEEGCQEFGGGRIGVRVVEGHDADDDCEQSEGDEGVREKRDRLAAEVAERFILRDVPSVHHGYQS